ncbi:MAG: phosphonate metabolism transcriptional regulator PhnF [Pseudomonadota bacterium]
MGQSALWASIADQLSGEIAAGHYAPGDKLPTEAALSQRFGVNRHTVRHALAALAKAGTVQARRGVGVFVAPQVTEYRLGRRVRFHQNLLASGRTPSRQILRLETRPCDGQEADALALSAGTAVHVVEGLSRADGVVIAMFRSVFPAPPFPDLLETMRQTGSVTAALAVAGVADYTRHSTRLTAIAADALLALHLALPQGAPLLRSVAVNVDPHGKPVEFGTTWFAGDRVTVTLTGGEAP